jgi:hypothetical protein
MFWRLLIGAGLLALGYYVGREVGRTNHIREAMRTPGHEPPPVPQPSDEAPAPSEHVPPHRRGPA